MSSVFHGIYIHGHRVENIVFVGFLVYEDHDS